MSIEQQQPVPVEAAPIKQNYLNEVITELQKTTWPTRPEALRLTYVVITVIVTLGIYMALLDAGLGAIFNRILHH